MHYKGRKKKNLMKINEAEMAMTPSTILKKHKDLQGCTIHSLRTTDLTAVKRGLLNILLIKILSTKLKAICKIELQNVACGSKSLTIPSRNLPCYG